MSKPAKGTKRVCASCGARFYDLGRTPIICPACQTVYQVIPQPTRRGERAAPEVRKKVEPALEPVVLEPETISLEEVEEPGDDVPIESDEEIVDLGEVEAEIPAGDDDNAFLEVPEGDEEADVSGIVSGPGQGEET